MRNFLKSTSVVFGLILSLMLFTATDAKSQTYQFSNYTFEYERSPNLVIGCANYIGPGCALPGGPLPPLTVDGCFINEVWTGAFCGWPRLVKWLKPADLPWGCSTRNGPGCELPGQPPLTSELCFAHERFIRFVATTPAYGGMCMVRAETSARTKPAIDAGAGGDRIEK